MMIFMMINNDKFQLSIALVMAHERNCSMNLKSDFE